MTIAFDRNLAYPCDDVGAYQEVSGVVVETGEPLGGSVRVVIETEKHGRITGYARKPMARSAKRAVWACIRVYDAGGGFYPDNSVTRLSR